MYFFSAEPVEWHFMRRQVIYIYLENITANIVQLQCKVKQKSTYDLFNQNKLSYELASNSYANVSNSL